MSGTNIIRTFPGEKDFSLFEKLPVLLYPAHSPRFALPGSINTEFLTDCYVLMESDMPLASLSLYMNPHLSYNGARAACIGNYECTENNKASQLLLYHAFAEAKKKGAGYVIGPMNGSTWDNYRFSTDHDHPLFFPESYHHLYYSAQFLQAGLGKIAGYFSALEAELVYDQPAILEREQELRSIGMTLRNIDVKNYRAELERLFPFITNAFRTNFLYTPITKETFMNKYLETEKLADPEFVFMAEDEHKEVIGVFFCVRDIFCKSEKRMVVKTIARDPDKKWSGLGHVMGNELVKRCALNGYSALVHAFIYEQGTSTGISKNYAGKRYKQYSLFGKTL
jgi:hypothetical protein